jgi:hypothetical protein
LVVPHPDNRVHASRERSGEYNLADGIYAAVPDNADKWRAEVALPVVDGGESPFLHCRRPFGIGDRAGEAHRAAIAEES